MADEIVPQTHMVLYEAPDGSFQMDIRLENDTLWLTQAHLMELFGASKTTISEHIRNIITDGELSHEGTVRKIRTVQQEGSRSVKREVLHYNLDMAISVGYRVTSVRATQFRIWATSILREYLVKGFVMNDARLKEPEASPYFDELLERIRDIRASEKMFYHKVRDVFAATSTDYRKDASTAREFFKTIQNKLLYAVTNLRAAELIVARADATHATMGLTSYKGSKVRKQDIHTAKNYLTHDELTELNRLTAMYLDYAETKAQRRQTITMAEWVEQTAKFLEFNDYPDNDGPGKMSNKAMKTIVDDIYTTYDSARKTAEKELSEQQATTELNELTRHVTELNRKENP